MESTSKNRYKWKGSSWKETYRKRCFDNMRNNRQKLLDQFRNLDSKSELTNVQNVMTEEWEGIRPDHNLPPLDSNLFSRQVTNNSFDEETEEVLSFLEDIKNELYEQEKKLLLQYENNIKFENSLNENLWTCNALTCPICKINKIRLNRSVIFCSCGLRIDTQQDCITLDFIQEQLQESMKTHNNNCVEDPKFCISDIVDQTNLLLTCSSCDYMYIII